MFDRTEHFVVTHTERRGNRDVKIGKFYFILNNKTYNTLLGFRNAIRPFNLTVKEFYDIYYKTENEGYCKVCGNQCSFSDLVTGYKNYCSDSCFNKTPEKRKKISMRFVNADAKYQNYLVKRRKNWNSRTEEQIEQCSKNMSEGQKKIDPKLKSELGKTANDILQEMCRQNPEKRTNMVAKSLETKKKNNSFANGLSGKVKTELYKNVLFKCQGYEDLLIKYLIDENIDFVNRETLPIVNITSNTSKRYLADIYIPKYNLLIDVKSEYTMPIFEDEISRILERQNACFEQGMNFLVFAIHSKTIKRDRMLCEEDKKCFSEYLNMLISSQALDEGRFNDYPVIRSTLQAIGSGSAGKPNKRACDIV